jgi:hypothetical protein
MNIVRVSQGSKRVQTSWIAQHVNDHNGFRPWRDLGHDVTGIEVEGIVYFG